MMRTMRGRTKREEKQTRTQMEVGTNSERRMENGLVTRDKERRRDANRGGEERKMDVAAGARGKVVE